MTTIEFAGDADGSRYGMEGSSRVSQSGDLEIAATEVLLKEALAREATLRDCLRQRNEIVAALFAGREDAAMRVGKLTSRQREIMELVLLGHQSKRVAYETGLSQRTVEAHRATIMKKMGAKCLPELARLALAAGRTAEAPHERRGALRSGTHHHVGA